MVFPFLLVYSFLLQSSALQFDSYSCSVYDQTISTYIFSPQECLQGEDKHEIQLLPLFYMHFTLTNHIIIAVMLTFLIPPHHGHPCLHAHTLVSFFQHSYIHAIEYFFLIFLGQSFSYIHFFNVRPLLLHFIKHPFSYYHKCIILHISVALILSILP